MDRSGAHIRSTYTSIHRCVLQVFAYRCSTLRLLGYCGVRNCLPVLVGCRAARVAGSQADPQHKARGLSIEPDSFHSVTSGQARPGTSEQGLTTCSDDWRNWQLAKQETPGRGGTQGVPGPE